MKFCENCGAELKPGIAFCTECGSKAKPPATVAPQSAPQQPAMPPAQHNAPMNAQQNPYAAPHQMHPPAPSPYVYGTAPAKKKKSRVGLVVTLVIVFALLVFASVLVMLYLRNTPASQIDPFINAISTRDIGYLSTSTQPVGFTPSKAEWEAFCDAFEAPEDLKKLKTQLESQTKGLEFENAFPAVTIAKNEKPLFLFINHYKISIQPVSVYLGTESPSSTLTLNGEPYAAQSTGGGASYSGIMPGLYSAQLERNTAQGPVKTSAVTTLLFRVEAPNTIEFSKELFTVYVSNCLPGNTTIYLNGTYSDVQPQDGILTLENVSINTEIAIEVIQENGTRRASVMFNDTSRIHLGFSKYSGEDAPPPPTEISPTETPKEFAGAVSETEVNQIITEFYSSYMDCINAKSLTHLRRSTSLNNDVVAERLTRDGNMVNEFKFTSAICDIQSFINAEGLEPPIPKILVNATMSYEYRPRSSNGGYTNGSNRQSYEILYIDGEWQVNNFVGVGDAAYDNHQLGDFSA